MKIIVDQFWDGWHKYNRSLVFVEQRIEALLEMNGTNESRFNKYPSKRQKTGNLYKIQTHIKYIISRILNCTLYYYIYKLLIFDLVFFFFFPLIFYISHKDGLMMSITQTTYSNQQASIQNNHRKQLYTHLTSTVVVSWVVIFKFGFRA